MPVASACDAGRVTNLTSVASALGGPRIRPSPPQRPPGPSRLDPAWGARGPPARGFPPSRPEGDGQALPLSVTPPLRGVVGFKVSWSRRLTVTRRLGGPGLGLLGAGLPLPVLKEAPT
jgi:hypothetical protein